MEKEKREKKIVDRIIAGDYCGICGSGKTKLNAGICASKRRNCEREYQERVEQEEQERKQQNLIN
ncbi:MAG: hypothetical protein V4509_00500 [Patescibacteria group bacterium]